MSSLGLLVPRGLWALWSLRNQGDQGRTRPLPQVTVYLWGRSAALHLHTMRFSLGVEALRKEENEW